MAHNTKENTRKRRRCSLHLLKSGCLLMAFYFLQWYALLLRHSDRPSLAETTEKSRDKFPPFHAIPQSKPKPDRTNEENAPRRSAISADSLAASHPSEYNSSGWFWEFLPSSSSSKPYLVVCHRMEDWLYPVSNHFTVLRIVDGELPPWNATALLLHADKFCAGHAYVKEAVRRRREAPFLNWDSSPSPSLGGWNDGVFWPDAVRSSHVLRLLRDRPALVALRGEVFWRNHHGRTCADVDFVVDRQKERVSDECLTVHFVPGVSSAYLREYAEDGSRSGALGVRATADIYERRAVHPKADPKIVLPYDKFCSFLIRFDPYRLVRMFNATNYDVDAIVRHLFFRQLSEYKPCTRVLHCSGNPYTAYKCMSQGYKFHITMENSLVEGYVSEKLFNGALGSGIPIYFGAPDVGSYVNAKSFVYCNVSRAVIEEMRTFYPRAPKPRPFLFQRTSTGFWPTEEELYGWADGYLRSQLEPCVRRVMELDVNDTAFREVVSEQFITNPDVLSGQYPFRGIQFALDVMKNKR